MNYYTRLLHFISNVLCQKGLEKGNDLTFIWANDYLTVQKLCLETNQISFCAGRCRRLWLTFVWTWICDLNISSKAYRKDWCRVYFGWPTSITLVLRGWVIFIQKNGRGLWRNLRQIPPLSIQLYIFRKYLFEFLLYYVRKS